MSQESTTHDPVERARLLAEASGVVIDAKGAWLGRFPDWLLTHFRTYPEREAALQAVGLAE